MTAQTQKWFQGVSFFQIATHFSQYPQPSEVEVVFMGRSNSGKSSLINALCMQKKLARTSKSPGRTRQIHFLQFPPDKRDDCYLVDLPGYGFAQISKQEKKTWTSMMGGYLLKRPSLSIVVVVLDCRRGVLEVDLEAIDLVMGRVGLGLKVPLFVFAINKADQASQSQKHKAIQSVYQTKQSLLNATQTHTQELKEGGFVQSGVFLTTAKNSYDKGLIDLRTFIFDCVCLRKITLEHLA